MKTCTLCQTEKFLADFHRNSYAKDGHQSRCKECARRIARQHYAENTEHHKKLSKAYIQERPELRKKIRLKYMYNLEWEDYLAMFHAQGGTCYICNQECTKFPGLSVDHDHRCCPGDRSCGKCVRRLLCDACNNGLKFFRDNADRMRVAANYIEKF